jgi:hypothetical protein
MGRIYYASYTGTFTAAGGNSDIFSIQCADDKPVKLRGFRFSQISEVGDAAEEGLRVTVKRFPATYTVGSGGSAVTPVPVDSANTAFGGTVRANDTTVGTTSGSAVVLEEIGWNVRNSPCDFWYPDESFAPKAKQGEALAIVLETTLADDATFCVMCCLEEE